MSLMKFRSGPWQHRVVALLTALVILCIASNPELSVFVPVLDALGLDVLIYLVSAQLSVVIGSTVWPYLLQLYQRWGRRILRYVSQLVFSASGGYLRQLTLHVAIGGMMSAALSPNNTLKPLLRGSA